MMYFNWIITIRPGGKWKFDALHVCDNAENQARPLTLLRRPKRTNCEHILDKSKFDLFI